MKKTPTPTTAFLSEEVEEEEEEHAFREWMNPPPMGCKSVCVKKKSSVCFVVFFKACCCFLAKARNFFFRTSHRFVSFCVLCVLCVLSLSFSKEKKSGCVFLDIVCFWIILSLSIFNSYQQLVLFQSQQQKSKRCLLLYPWCHRTLFPSARWWRRRRRRLRENY